MNKEEFSGNCYIFVPCHYNDKLILPTKKNITPNSESYLKSFQEYFSIEVNSIIYQHMERVFLSRVDLLYLDDLEDNECDSFTVSAEFFLTYHTETKLAVIVISIFDTNIPITHMLDRISQNNIRIKLKENNILLDEYIKKFNLKKLNSGKVCLSVDREINKEIFPYYFANETYDSAIMTAKLRDDVFGQKQFENIAQYHSSDLYVGKTSILRVDKRDYGTENKNRITSDILFLFILEVLILKEASIERTNQKLVKYISSSENISVKHLSKLTTEFSLTMPFWDINVFTYITSQNLANKIEKTFHIEEKYNKYLKNQKFLQHKINLKQAIEQEKENALLFYIAIIVFSFEIYSVFKDFIVSKSLSISLSCIVFFMLLILKYRRNKDLE